MGAGNDTGKTRREFLGELAVAGAAAVALPACFPEVGGRWAEVQSACLDESPAPVAGRAQVIEVHRPGAVSSPPELAIQAEQVRPMLDAALAALSGAAGGASPWPALLPDYRRGTRIGLKVNCLNPNVPTSLPLVRAVIASLREGLDVPPADLVVWDRTLEELTARGLTADALGVTVMGTFNAPDDRRGPGYSDALCGEVAGQAPRFSRILTELTDVTINCPVLKTHGVSGVTAGLKNIYGIIHNPGAYHENLVTALPALYRTPVIRDHIRLTLLDALVAVITGDTAALADAAPARFLAAQDPLALDHHAVALVNRLRVDLGVGLAPVSASLTAWLDHGHALGLGTLDYDLHTITQ
jgi:hypothetical protein